MRWIIALTACAVLSTGCLSYVSYNYSWSNDGPDADTVEVLLGIEAAIGLALAIGMIVVDEKRGDNWGIDLLAGVLTPFVIDGAIALGVGSSDFVAGARPPE